MRPEELCEGYDTYCAAGMAAEEALMRLRADVRALAERLGDPFGEFTDLLCFPPDSVADERGRLLRFFDEASRVRAALKGGQADGVR